jgi:hypothetical protein
LNDHSIPFGRTGFGRLAAFVAIVVLLTAAITSLLQAQISEEDKKKRDAFLKAREEMHTIPTATPSKSASPGAKPKPAKKKSKSGISTPKAEIDLIRERLKRLKEALR